MFTFRRYGGTSSTGSPSSMIWPLVGVSKPASILSVVVLPQPLGPSRLKNSPLAIVRLTSLTTVVSPKRLLTLSMRIASPFALMSLIASSLPCG